MANPTTQTVTPKPSNAVSPSAPKKPQSADQKRAARITGLQRSLDRACFAIHDGGSSYAIRATRAAREGIPRDTMEKGLLALEGAVLDARKAVEAAYNAPKSGTKTASRVRLG